MRNLLKTLICTAALVWGTTEVNAQSYKTGAGILVDAGDGTTFVGPHVKHFFSTHNALEGSVYCLVEEQLQFRLYINTTRQFPVQKVWLGMLVWDLP
jgi:hypothetical protein